MGVEFGVVGGSTVFQHHAGDDDLAPVGIGYADRRDLAHVRMRQQRFLDFARIDIGAAGDDDVLGAVRQRQEAVFIEPADIAGAQPAVLQRLGIGLGIVPIAEHHGRSLGLDLAGLARGQRLPVGDR